MKQNVFETLVPLAAATRRSSSSVLYHHPLRSEKNVQCKSFTLYSTKPSRRRFLVTIDARGSCFVGVTAMPLLMSSTTSFSESVYSVHTRCNSLDETFNLLLQ